MLFHRMVSLLVLATGNQEDIFVSYKVFICYIVEYEPSFMTTGMGL